MGRLRDREGIDRFPPDSPSAIVSQSVPDGDVNRRGQRLRLWRVALLRCRDAGRSLLAHPASNRWLAGRTPRVVVPRGIAG